MDFLNKAFQQLGDTIRPMSASAKITTLLLLAVVVIGVVMLFQFDTLGSNEYLLGAHVFSQAELNAAAGAFATAQLDDYQVENSRIRVPLAQRHKYIAAMAAANALPKSAEYYWSQMFDGGLLESSETRKFRDQYRKTRALERTLSEVAGVQQAKVEYNVQPAATLTGEPTKSALVAITPSSSTGVDARLVKSIRTTAAYFLNMDANQIAILDQKTGQAFKGDAVGPGAFGDDEYTAYKAIRENELATKLYDQLSHIPGVKINVQIELEPELRHEIETLSYNDKPTAAHTSAMQEELTTSQGSVAGRPGVDANDGVNGVANSSATVVDNSTESTRNISRDTQRALVGQERVRREFLPFSPKNVTVSVSVPKSHVHAVWSLQNPPADGSAAQPPSQTDREAIETEVSNNIEELVNNLLPRVDTGIAPFPRVKVKFVNDISLPPLEGPGTSALVVEWLQDYWSTIALGILGLAGLIFLRGMLKPSEASGPGLEISVTADARGEGGAASREPATKPQDELDGLSHLRMKMRRDSGSNLRDELTDIVREDPDAAASVLSVWIGERG